METLYSPRDIIRAGLCIGCGACVSRSSDAASMRFDSFGQIKPFGPKGWMTSSSTEFNSICPFSPDAINEDQLAAELFPAAESADELIGRFQGAYVGYAAESDFRSRGSSGGLVTWVATELFRRKLVDGVAHVVSVDDPQADGRFFRYEISRTEDEIRRGAKSRYYPIELSSILKQITSTPGRYLVVGIPCFIKAVQLLRRKDPILRKRIAFTLGLFCGHMKSARFVESFAWQMKVPIHEVARVDFRYKDPSRPANWYNARLTLRDGSVVNKDWWHLADGDWGAGFFQNSACDYCDDVVAETADISFGDAWVEPYSSDGRGTNVVVVRSPEIGSLLNDAIAAGRLHLENVGADFVVETQAAGFRQRREGLAYRLSLSRVGILPVKRVAPNSLKLDRRRKLIYRLRLSISRWSHKLFMIARLSRLPALYIFWARVLATVYHRVAYSTSRMNRFAQWLGID